MPIKSNIPKYGNIIASADTFAELRSIHSKNVSDGTNAIVSGALTRTDGDGGMFIWNPLTTAPDDDADLIAPADGGTGRWHRVGVAGARGPQGEGLAEVMAPTGAGFVGTVRGPLDAVLVNSPARFSRFFDAVANASSDLSSLFIDDRGGTLWRKVPTGKTVTADQNGFSWFANAKGAWELATQPAPLEAFGAVGDYNYQTGTGTDNTAALQAALNYARRNGVALLASAGAKYLTDTIHGNYDAVKNPVDPDRRPGRFALVGAAGGIASGSQEPAGAALVHKNGSAGPLLSVKGSFSIENPAAMGGHVFIDRVNFIGGDQTTHVLYFEACQGQMWLSNYTVRVYNMAGNGITENTTWEMMHFNGTINGPSIQLAPSDPAYNAALLATGVGLDIKDNGSIGQTNMKIYNNVNVYGMGYGVRIGRRASGGTFGPLKFIGGQVSWSGYDGMWIDGGTFNIAIDSMQFENSRLNGTRVDSAGASALAYQVKLDNCFYANNGLVQDGTAASAHVNIVDGQQCVIEDCSFWDTRTGIAFDASRAVDLKIIRPKFRTVAPWGVSSGTNIFAYGTLMRGMRTDMTGLQIDNGCATQVNTLAAQSFALARQFYSVGASAPNISLGFASGSEPAVEIFFDNSAPVGVTGFLGGRPGHILRVRSSNSNTTLVASTNLKLRGDANLTVDRTRMFYCVDGLVFQEIG